MFSHVFQNGEAGVEIFSASGKSPGSGWKVSSTIHRVYDRTVKGFVYLIDKPSTATMQIPENNRDHLGLTQRYLIVQMRPSSAKIFTLEINLLERGGQRHRFHLSSKFRQFEIKALHAQIPVDLQTSEAVWLNVILDLTSLCSNFFKTSYASVESICIHPCCRVRKVFTLPQIDITDTFLCPPLFEFPSGTPTAWQVTI